MSACQLDSVKRQARDFKGTLINNYLINFTFV